MKSQFSFALAALASALVLLAPCVAKAHVTLETREAPVGSYYKAVLRVPHGCNGSPTVRLRVRIPDGVIGVKPQPKPGWSLETIRAAYGKTYASQHGQVSEGVREIVWSGKLPDEYFDEFAFQAYLSPALKAGSRLAFPVVQECEQGVERWIDAADGKGRNPAPSLKLLPKRP